MIDKEQTRRDAEDGNLIGWKTVLALLVELEQAEQKRDEFKERCEGAFRTLSKVRDQFQHEHMDNKKLQQVLIEETNERLDANTSLEQAERKEIRLREALNGALSNQSEWWEKAEQALNYDGT